MKTHSTLQKVQKVLKLKSMGGEREAMGGLCGCMGFMRGGGGTDNLVLP